MIEPHEPGLTSALREPQTLIRRHRHLRSSNTQQRTTRPVMLRVTARYRNQQERPPLVLSTMRLHPNRRLHRIGADLTNRLFDGVQLLP